MDCTIVVAVKRVMKHPQYGKIVSRTSKVYAHDAENQAGIGDLVTVMETRPISKTKRWRLEKILEKAK
jgi:small subunit ribosomal protein S17